MLFGAGNLAFLSKDLTETSLRGENLLYPAYLSEFELTADTNLLEAKALIGGKRQIVAAAINEEIFTLKVSTEFVDWHATQFAYDELAQTTASVALPLLVAAAVPRVSPYTVTNSGITAANANSVKVYVASTPGKPGQRKFLKIVTAAPANADEVQLAAATGTLTFHSSLAGSQVQFVFDKTYTNIETIGVEQEYDAWGRLEFVGLAYGTEFPGQMLIRVPELSRISTPTISIAGDVTRLDIEFRASVPAGQRRPFQLFNLSA